VANNQVSLNVAQKICTDPWAGVVTGPNSSLMWTKCAYGQEMYDPDCAGTAARYSNQTQANQACNGLVLGSYSDWRLPKHSEFSTIAPQDRSAPLFPGPSGKFWMKGSIPATPVVMKYRYMYQGTCGTSHPKSCTPTWHKYMGTLYTGKWATFYGSPYISYSSSTYSYYEENIRNLKGREYDPSFFASSIIADYTSNRYRVTTSKEIGYLSFYNQFMDFMNGQITSSIQAKTRCVRN